MPKALSKEELKTMDAYWRAANYLSVGQIYLYDNPLLKEKLTLKHIKPRLLGHWGTTPGLNFIYVHLNRVIKAYDLDVIYVTGPGHGGPGLVANAYLEGTYSEVYTHISQDEAGMKELFKQFSFPGGIPSHVAPETPGSIHMELHSTTRTSLSPVLSETASQRQGLLQLHGTRINFSIRFVTALYCLSCILTATRSQILRYWPESAMMN